MIRCFLVDDEPLARRHIELQLAPHADFEVVQSLADSRAALELAVQDPPELIFLDVKMPGMGGMEFLAALQRRVSLEQRPYVILVTAFERYALQAFEYGALDYMVKPLDAERFASSLARARLRMAHIPRPSSSAGTPPPPPLELRAGSKQQFVDPTTIIWIEAADHYLYVHLEARSHLVRKSMGSMELELASMCFLRVHRGALVNPRFVVEVHPKSDGGRWLLLCEGSRIPVSRRRWPELKPRLRP